MDDQDEYDKTLGPLFDRRDALVAQIEALGEEIREAIIRARQGAIHRAVVEDR